MAMTSTTTRSTRRVEGQPQPHLHHQAHRYSSKPNGAAAAHPLTRLQQQQAATTARPLKRLHDAVNHDHDPDPDLDAIKAKRAKITVEILSTKQYQAKNAPGSGVSRHVRHARHGSATHNHHGHTDPLSKPLQNVQRQRQQQRPPGPAPTAHNATLPAVLPPPPPAVPAAVPPMGAAPAPVPVPPSPEAAKTINKTTGIAKGKHQKKATNRIKHELDRLQPNSADMADNNQGRKLRSQEATRFKSELSVYFPEYDEWIGNVPKEHHILNLDTLIILVENDTSSTSASASASASTSIPHPSLSASSSHLPHPPPPSATRPVRSYGDELFTNVHDTNHIDFGFLESQYKGKELHDPLPDSFFEHRHKKETRAEKSQKNIEIGRSHHEKEQISRLLDGLQGPDWLRVMGVSGITESKKKGFEPARAHFIKGCEAALEKFARYAAEEKRRKLEKDRAAKQARASRASSSPTAEPEQQDAVLADIPAEKEEAQDDEDVKMAEEEEDEDAELADEDEDVEMADEDDRRTPSAGASSLSDGDGPAKQLREEAMARSRLRRNAGRGQAKHHPHPPSPSPQPEREFTSFFKKPYLREAALSHSRRRGRNILAWGQIFPEPPERDFDIPDEFLDEEFMKAHERRKRRDRRGHGQ